MQSGDVPVARDETLRIVGGRVLTRSGWAETDVLVRGGVVAPDAEALHTVDASGCTVVPGFIDLQVNGAFGHDFTARPESIREVARQLPRYGVTAFLPTIVSSPPGVARRALRVLGGRQEGRGGARPLGLHCEGPMLAAGRRGAHEASRLLPATETVIEGWSRAAGVRMVTIAPELEGAGAITKTLVDRGVVVSAGHSDATYEEALQGFAAGISFGTHLFNAMSQMEPREPGLVGALLARPEIGAGLIADGVHVHPANVALAWNAKGRGGIALVSDSIAALGGDDGDFPLGDALVTVRGGIARNAEGRLAGSVLSMDQAVRNLIEFTGCELADAVLAASSTPARVIGEEAMGYIGPGARADLVLLDAAHRVVATLVGGRVVFDAGGRSSAP